MQTTSSTEVLSAPTTNFWDWASTIPWFAWIAALAVVGGVAMAITGMVITHREKLAGLSRDGEA
jgi:hypothetical protein